MWRFGWLVLEGWRGCVLSSELRIWFCRMICKVQQSGEKLTAVVSRVRTCQTGSLGITKHIFTCVNWRSGW